MTLCHVAGLPRGRDKDRPVSCTHSFYRIKSRLMTGTSRSDTGHCFFFVSWATAGELIRFGAGALPSSVVLTDASTEIWLHSAMPAGVSWHLDFSRRTENKTEASCVTHGRRGAMRAWVKLSVKGARS